MKLKLIQVGKTKDAWLMEGIAEYQKRLTPFVKLSLCELPDYSVKSAGDREVVKQQEATGILKQVGDDDYLILLDENGAEKTSLEFSDFLVSISNRKQVVFVIGGVYGVHRSVFERADTQLALSRFTFTHRMARLILMEQLYRAMMINANRNYHVL